MAMGITLAENRLDLTGDRLFIEDRGIDAGPIAWGPRIGIRVGTERPWRAHVAGHRAVSGATKGRRSSCRAARRRYRLLTHFASAHASVCRSRRSMQLLIRSIV